MAANPGEALSTTPPIVARVLQRMQASGGVPALTRSVAQIVDALQEGQSDAQTLVNAVLADVSLTQKVLRLANSSMYSAFGGNVSTVSQALKILGVDAVGHLALGARLIGSPREGHNGQGDGELAHSLLAGSVAKTLAQELNVADSETGVVCSILNRTGRLLAASYLPDEWEQIEHHMEAGLSEAEAARKAMEIDFETLGRHVAETWKLPTRIVQTLASPPHNPLDHGHEDAWLFALTHFSNQAAELVSQHTESGQDAEILDLNGLAERYGNVLGISQDTLVGATRSSAAQMHAEPALGQILKKSAATRKKSAHVVSKPENTLALLQAGLQTVEQGLAGGSSRNEASLMALEIIYTALGLDRVALFLRDSRQQAFRVVAGLARKDRHHLMELSFPEAFSANVAHVALKNNVDIYIDNPRDEKIASRLPDWLRNHAPQPFFLLPMATDSGLPFGLLFGQQAHASLVHKDELHALKALRDLLRNGYLK